MLCMNLRRMQCESVGGPLVRHRANYLQRLAAAVAVVAPAGLGCSRTKMMGRRRMAGLRAQLAPSNVTAGWLAGKGEARKQQ